MAAIKSALISAILVVFALGQALDDAISTTLPECLKLDNYIFCNPNNVSTNPNREAYEGFGWCCPLGSTSANCQEGSNNIECTNGPALQQGEPLYRTFWVGMTPEICNSTETTLTPTTDKKFFYADKFVIGQRVALDYEACLWRIEVEDEKYRDDTGAYIELRLESLTNAIAYIYDGTGRNNATAVIEANNTAVLGGPIRVPISSKLMLVAYTAPYAVTGQISFSYQLFDAEEYPFFYQPFVGLDEWIWTVTLIGIACSPLLICVVLVLSLRCCACCRSCCSCCVCSDCCIPSSILKLTKEPEVSKINKVNALEEKQPSRYPDTEGSQGVEFGERRLSMPHESDEQMRNISEFSENETVPVHGADETHMGSPRNSAHALPTRNEIASSSVKDFDSKGRRIDIYDTNNNTHARNEVNHLNISERPNFEVDPTRSYDQTFMPPSDMSSYYMGNNNNDVVSGRNKTQNASKYSLKPTIANMEEVDAPQTASVLGGVSQSQNQAPVQFYRFTNDRKKQIQQELYQDPFNPMIQQQMFTDGSVGGYNASQRDGDISQRQGTGNQSRR